MSLPTIAIGPHRISRMTIGGNPFVEVIRRIRKPCIGYKILGAGRVPAAQAVESAFANIKPTDAVNVGMFTKDNPRMVQENVALALKAMRA